MEPNQPQDLAGQGKVGESLASYQQRQRDEAWAKSQVVAGNALHVEPETTESVVGYSDEKKKMLAAQSEKSEKSEKSPRKRS